MKIKKYKLTLYNQFAFVFIILIFIPIIVVGGISYLNSKQSIESMVYELLKQEVENINSQFSNIYEDIGTFSLNLVTNDVVRSYVNLSEQDYFEKYDFYTWSEENLGFGQLLKRVPVISNITIIGDNGICFSYDNPRGYDPKINYSVSEKLTIDNKNFTKNLPDDGSLKVFIFDVKPTKTGSSKQIVSFARRIYSERGDKTIGTVYINIIADTMNNLWEDTSNDSKYIWIANKEGLIIYHKDSKKIGQTVDSFLSRELDQEEKPKTVLEKISDKDDYIVHNKSKNTGWMVGATIPASMINAPAKNLRNVIIFVSLFVFPITMVAGYVLMKSITKPLRILQYHMKEASKENWVPVKNNMINNEVGDLLITYNKMIKKIETLIEEIYKAELSNKLHELEVQKAEFQALQMQINPHFLYNTLGTINAYAMVFKDNSIQEMTQALGNMFRYAVQNPLETVNFSDEINHVKNYLIIQRYRQDIMPEIKWNIDESLLGLPVLRLTIQPVIENVFNHAFFQGITSESCIKVSAYVEENCFILKVEDNGQGLGGSSGKSNHGTGIGIKNIDRRIKLAFGNEYGVVISNGIDIGAVVIIRYPLQENMIKFKQV
jgi:two-component system, sensor histidine kinase YesM